MDVEMPKGRSFQKGYRGMELQIYDDDLDRFDQVVIEVFWCLNKYLMHLLFVYLFI